jgi:DNA polymerase I-like protein with 3'-5' exonuclease and polymerase domains
MDTYAIDFETYYDKRCSIKTLGPLGYFSHPDFDAYMVSVVGDNGVKFVGHPKDFDWSLIQDNRVLSHNASFDESLYLYGARQGWWDSYTAAEWHCTADMAVYCGLPRSLKGATAEAYDLKVDKSTRDNMSGKKWENMSPDFKKEVSDYALKDSELCLKLWQDYSDKWTEKEREISLINRRCVQHGIPIDTELLKNQLETIKKELFEAENNIPWIGDRPLLSRQAFDDQCRAVGIEPPASLAEGDADAEEWLRVHGQKYAWVGAVKNWRRINSLKCKLESFDFATMSDGRFYGNLMYFGAHTGRFSGSGGNLNLQNLPKDEMFGVNMRHLIAPKPDRRLVVVDLSQIEVRTLCWLAQDHETMEEIKASEDIYEAFAIRFGLWSKDKGSLRKDPKMRHKVKAMVLGCFGPETKVLTDRGWIDIVGVRDTDKVWDGTQWVHHEGLLHQGVQETISRFGVEATPDHEILTEHGWREWYEIQRSEKDLKSALVMASLPSCHTSEQHEKMAGLDGIHWSDVRAAGSGLLTAITCRIGKLLDAIVVLRKPPHEQPCVGSSMQKLYRIKHIENDYSTALVPSITDATIRRMPHTTTMGVAGFGSMSLGSTTGRNFLLTLSHLMGGINHIFNSIGSITTKVMNRTIFGSLLRCRICTIGGLLGVCKKESKSLRRKSDVYDLKNCGPNNRFTIKTDFGPIIVHNCGYGAGAPKFAIMSGMTEKEAKEAVDLYRLKMDNVKKLWSSYNADIRGSFSVETNFTVDLPSGRVLDYGRLQIHKQDEKVLYVALMPKNGKRVPVKLWGGLVAENASQALARDIFSHMLCEIYRLPHADLIMHVHDEVVVETDADKAEQVLSEIISIMSTPPPWIPDIPLAAEGTILTKYEK